MFKTILVSLTGFESDTPALDTAYLAARRSNAHIQCLHVRGDAAQMAARLSATTDLTSGIDGSLLAAMEEESEMRSKRAHLAFAEFCKRWSIALAAEPPGPGAVSAAWREIEGDEADVTIAQARFHDVTIMGRAPSGGLSIDGIGAVLVGSGRPLLLAPTQAPENLGATLAVAWKDTPEAARALTAAGPVLSKAEKVFLLSAAENGGSRGSFESAELAARQLRWSGLNAEARRVESGGRPLPQAVLDSAVALGADLLIMGAYGHSRLREFVFGGFTRAVLTASPLPVFLFH